MPGLAVALTLEHQKSRLSENVAMGTVVTDDAISDVVSFVSGLLLGNDINVRNWFAQFIRIGQKVISFFSLVDVTMWYFCHSNDHPGVVHF